MSLPSNTLQDKTTPEFPGLERNALQIFGVPWADLTPNLKARVRKCTIEDAAGEMLAALKFVKEFFRKMEDHDLPGDPLIELRRKFHAPVHAELDAAISKAEGRV